MQVDGDLEGMVLAVEGEDAADGYRAGGGEVDGAIDVGGAEGDGGVLRAFEDGGVHALIAGGVAAFAAGGVDDDEAGGFAGSGIDFEGAALELEGAVDGVECGVEGPVDSGGCGVESDGERRLRLLREGAGGERKQEGATQGREESLNPTSDEKPSDMGHPVRGDCGWRFMRVRLS